ncbi:unnamed protein product, partial [Haemonchus placei]|uniref:Ground-like domain-containing protein n=1 Tax=Haemonchus placei TaxID=6290 RepID=A0A0N4WN31_HAEPC
SWLIPVLRNPSLLRKESQLKSSSKNEFQNIDENLNSSKRLIQLAAEAQFGGRFDVICANGDFSYVTNTELFCQETKGDVSCYTYRQL